jgi:Zn-dependent peptidase ImmA (M78 family)
MSVQLARAAAEKLVQRLGIRTPPINVEGIADALGLRIVIEDLGDDVSGLLVSRDGKATIAVKKGDPTVRRRFTIAHEIGHFLLRHHLQRNELVHADQVWQVTYRSPQSSEGLDPLEIQANQFAASLLMPTELIRKRVLAGNKPLPEQDVKRLARDFVVSEQAMTIRLSTLGLI